LPTKRAQYEPNTTISIAINIFWREQDDAAQQVRNIGKSQAIEGDNESCQNHQPKGDDSEQRGGIPAHARLPQKIVRARPLGQYIEVHGAQRALDGEAYRLGKQPSHGDHEQRQ